MFTLYGQLRESADVFSFVFRTTLRTLNKTNARVHHRIPTCRTKQTRRTLLQSSPTCPVTSVKM